MEPYFFDRDISWLFFNERVLKEAGKTGLPPGEKVNFLSIYSSNLDEFYRVRIPSLMSLEKIHKKRGIGVVLSKIKTIIEDQHTLYGNLIEKVVEELYQHHQIAFLYNKSFPGELQQTLDDYFITSIAAYLHPIFLDEKPDFFPENNAVYLAVSVIRDARRQMAVVNVPSDIIERFCVKTINSTRYIAFLDDIIADNLNKIFPGYTIQNTHSFKITRDAELDLKDSYEDDLADKIEEQLLKRDMGFATRFLYDSQMPETDLTALVGHLNLQRANQVAGGRYHNLKDLAGLPLPNDPKLFYDKWAPIEVPLPETVFQKIESADFLLNPPYEDYKTLLRFFNEAALDETVSEIFLAVYRIASDSSIAQALISAAKNGKKVTVFVELKARFDEANNIHWAKKMEAAGVHIIYSIPGWKVHAKVALIKRRFHQRVKYYGLLGTGNFNETTAKVYADHIFFTTHPQILRELELLFLFLKKRRRIEGNPYQIRFRQLLVARFNLFDRLSELIDFEIDRAKAGEKAEITLKLNNLDEERLISKLYEASNAGVSVNLLVRSICRLVPGVERMSENIKVRRIVDRYLEHARIYKFYHRGEDLMFSGSADWMNRNIKRRIEVCYPVYDMAIREQLNKSLELGFADNSQAVTIDKTLANIPVTHDKSTLQSQREFYEYLKDKSVS